MGRRPPRGLAIIDHLVQGVTPVRPFDFKWSRDHMVVQAKGLRTLARASTGRELAPRHHKPRSAAKTSLYPHSEPIKDFNKVIGDWLEGAVRLREHTTPAAFEGLRKAYLDVIEIAVGSGFSLRDAHRTALSKLTDLLFGHDLAAELAPRLNPGLVREGGFRTTLAQGVAKNVGENFVNLLTYALAHLLRHQDEVLVDKGFPPKLKKSLALKRIVPLKTGDREIHIPIEGDLSIFARSNPLNAIAISAKTRLKEVFHVGTMWKMLFDTLDDAHCLSKWQLTPATKESIEDVLYVFATADMVHKGGRNSQGPDVERPLPRNLIAMDASFFDYVFVSKTGIPHVENQIQLGHRGALFHELGCLIDLIEQKFGIDLSQIKS